MDQSESLASERRPWVSAHLCGSGAHEVCGRPSGHGGVSTDGQISSSLTFKTSGLQSGQQHVP
ncbi:hypothetical protein EYF80_062829 [Liparis tanakae]|uniref:Uncharacterized protein n=1 Tax=Liparis tanakae TaxID=230148 RepID=A0A4Z2EE43_9TELE|nr:hypothetical protein EYF80_062829 [Liparis tanakae]